MYLWLNLIILFNNANQLINIPEELQRLSGFHLNCPARSMIYGFFHVEGDEIGDGFSDVHDIWQVLGRFNSFMSF